MIDPARVRAPPTTTIVSSRIEASRSNDDGSMKLRNVGVQAAGDAGERAGQRGGFDLGAQHALAGGRHRQFVLADRAQQPAERRAHDQPEAEAAESPRRRCSAHDTGAVSSSVTPKMIGRRDAGQAVGAAGARRSSW